MKNKVMKEVVKNIKKYRIENELLNFEGKAIYCTARELTEQGLFLAEQRREDRSRCLENIIKIMEEK
jgi:hypothetical protein